MMVPTIIQMGSNARAIFNTREIRTVTRKTIAITEEDRDRYERFICEDDKAYVIFINLLDGGHYEFKCASEEY